MFVSEQEDILSSVLRWRKRMPYEFNENSRHEISSLIVSLSLLLWSRTERASRQLQMGEERFAAYLDGVTKMLGHTSRVASARAYCTVLLLPGERKSIEPMAARVEPGQVQTVHHSMHHVVAKADWDDAAMLTAVRQPVLPAIERHGPMAYWIVDDTGFPKKGQQLVGLVLQPEFT